MNVALSLTVLGLFGYLFLYSTFVEDVPGSNERVVRGYVQLSISTYPCSGRLLILSASAP